METAGKKKEAQFKPFFTIRKERVDFCFFQAHKKIVLIFNNAKFSFFFRV
jgi:hypothetical protein